MNRPIIGIVAGYSDQGGGLPRVQTIRFYPDSVTASGGVPVLFPITTDAAVMESWLDLVDAVVFCGGPDIDPARYGRPRHERTKPLTPELETFLLEMFRRVDARGDLPALGICLGCQVFAVGRGGALHQHVPDLARDGAVTHGIPQDPYAGSLCEHSVTVAEGSVLARAIGAGELTVNSSHHQAVESCGQGLVPAARSVDGIVEAVEDPGRPFFLAVQWHPEEIADRPQHRALFDALVEAARQRTAAVAAQ